LAAATMARAMPVFPEVGSTRVVFPCQCAREHNLVREHILVREQILVRRRWMSEGGLCEKERERILVRGKISKRTHSSKLTLHERGS